MISQLNEDFRAKVADFGLVEIAKKCSSKSFAGTRLYKAPEVGLEIQTDHPHKQDVYSFGILMYILLYEKRPFENYQDDDFIEKVWKGGQRPDLQGDIPEKLKSLIRACWDADPAKRPEFREIAEELSAMDEKPVKQVEKLFSSSDFNIEVRLETPTTSSASDIQSSATVFTQPSTEESTISIPTKETVPVKEAVPVKKITSVKQNISAKQNIPVKQNVPEKQNIPEKETISVKETPKTSSSPIVNKIVQKRKSMIAQPSPGNFAVKRGSVEKLKNISIVQQRLRMWNQITVHK